MKPLHPFRIVLFSLLVLVLTSACRGEPDSVLAFFYMEHCPGCDTYIRADEIKNTVQGMKKQYRIMTVNLVTEENFTDLRRVIEEQNLPDVSRSLPLLIFDGQYVNGYDSIEAKLHEIGEAR